MEWCLSSREQVKNGPHWGRRWAGLVGVFDYVVVVDVGWALLFLSFLFVYYSSNKEIKKKREKL